MKKFFAITAGLVCSALVLLATLSYRAAAADYTITIVDNAVSKNQNVIYDYQNIGPGFTADANIVINNNSNFATQVKLISVAPDAADPNQMLPYVQIKLSQNGVVLGQGTFDSDTLLGATTCIDPHFSTTLTNNFLLPASVNNAAQNTSMRVIYTFLVEQNGCETVAPPNTAGPNTLPPTGETMWPFWILGGITIAFFGLAMIFLILVLDKRRRDNRAVILVDNAPVNNG